MVLLQMDFQTSSYWFPQIESPISQDIDLAIQAERNPSVSAIYRTITEPEFSRKA